MIESKVRRNSIRLCALPVLGLAFGMLANQAEAQSLYFDVNGTTAGYGITTGSTYSWDSANWAAASGGAAATNNWVQGDFARFPGGVSGNSYTVTVSGDEQNIGLFETVAGVNLTLNAIGSGSLDVLPGAGGAAQGILNGGSASTLTINAPITGTGGIEPGNGGNIVLNGVNTYSGGTLLASSTTLTYFNNGSAFGTNTITLGEASGSVAPLLATGGATITLPNNWVNSISGGGINFASNANTPLVNSGTWSLGANNIYLKNNGNSTAPVSLTNTISGTAGLTIGGANGGTILLSGANTYSGTTTVGATAATSVTLKLGAANTIASSSSVILAGGTLNPDGLNQIMSSTTLGMTATSTIDFGVGASEMDFANSSLLTWTAGTTLNLTNWNPSVDAIRFGTDSTGLSSAQLAKILFNGVNTGTTALDAHGYVVAAATSSSSTPEPSTWALMGMGLSVAGVGTRSLKKRRVRFV